MTCSVCGKSDAATISAKRLVKSVREILVAHFEIYQDLYSGHNGLSLSKAIGTVIGSTDSIICEVIASFLKVPITDKESESNFFAEGQEYAENQFTFDSEDDERTFLSGKWESIARNLTYKQRFFNKEAERFFEVLFQEAISSRHHTGLGSSSSVIAQCPAGMILYRARRISSQDEVRKIQLEPHIQLGAPPKEAARHNRMSASGISLLYASENFKTCIAEVRPSIGDEVAVGEFCTNRTLRLFDFRALNNRSTQPRLSYFIDNYIERKHHRAFLGYLHDAIAQPVRPEKENDYIVTQAMAEYLCHHCPENFDGVIFESVQTPDGINYVLFTDRVLENKIHQDNWQARFPVELIGQPKIYTVKAVNYTFS